MQTPKIDQQKMLHVSKLEGVVEGLAQALRKLLTSEQGYQLVWDAHERAVEAHRVALDEFVKHVQGELERTNPDLPFVSNGALRRASAV
jgi:hypothetical protein